MTNNISLSTTKSLFKRPLTGLWVIAFVLALLASVTPRASAQTFDKAHASAIVLAGNGNDPVNTLTLSATAGTAPISLLFPNAATAASYVLKSDGLGGLTWSNISGSGITSIIGTSPINASTVSGVATISITTGNLTSSGSITVGGTGATVGSGITANLNLGNLNTWTGEQSFNGGISSTSGNNLYINDSSTGSQATDIDAFGPAGVVNIGNAGSTTNFLGTVSFPAGSVTASSIGLAKNDVFIGDATLGTADTATVTQDVTFENTGAHVAQATVNGSHATTFTATGAVTVDGLTTTSGGLTNTGALTTSGGAANINTTASALNTTSIGNSGANVVITGGGIDLYGGVGSQPNGSVNVMTGNLSVQAGNIGVATGTIGVGGHTVIDNSDDLTNIKAITASSTITFSGLPVGAAPGIVHANGVGVLSSSLIVNGDITPGTVTYAKINNETASTLLGNPTASAASPSEITLGSGLSFSGTTLTATGTGGTVTSVSVTTANGVSGTVLNPTTTPAISLTLGAITPTSVAATGTITGAGLTSDVSTNTGAAGAALTLDNTGGAGGYDVTGTGNTWYVTDAGLGSFSGLNNTGTLRTTGGTTDINTTGTNPINIGDTSGAMNINIGNNSGPSVTTLGGTVDFTGTVNLPAGSVTSSSLGLAKNDILIGDATSATADTAMVTQDVTLENTSTHVAQATVNGSHATTFTATGAVTVDGLTTTSGGLTNTGGLTTSGGAANINSTLAGSPSTTNIDASPATGGTNNIGNNTTGLGDSSTTNINGNVDLTGAVVFSGPVTLPAGSVTASSIGLAKNDVFIGDATLGTADTAMMTQDVTLQNTSTHVAQATVNGSHATTFAVANAETVGTTLGVTGLTTATGGISVPTAAGINNSGGVTNISSPSTVGVLNSTTNINAGSGQEGVINIGNNGGAIPADSSTTNIAGAVNVTGNVVFSGTVTLPAGSVTSSSLGLAKNDIYIGDATSATADTAMMTQDVTLQNTSTHVAQATVNGSHATTFAVANAETVGTTLGVTGLTTATGGISTPSSGGINNSGSGNTTNIDNGATGGTNNVGNTTSTTNIYGSTNISTPASAGIVVATTDIDAGPGQEGVINIGNNGGAIPADSSTTNIAGAVNVTGNVVFSGTVTLPAGSVTSSSLGLAKNDIYIGDATSATADTAMMTQDVTLQNTSTHVAQATVNGSHATTFAVANAETVGTTLGVTGLTTATGGISTPSSGGINNSSVANTIVASTTNIDATTGAEGVINIGNAGGTTPLDSSTTNIAGALNISGTTNFTGSVTFTTAPAIPLTTNDLFVGVAGVATPLATANGGVLNTSSLGVPSITPTPTLGVAGTTAGTLTLASGAAAFTTQLATSATTPTASYVYQFPAQTPTSPTNGQVLTAGTPTGTGPYTIPLSWATPASVSSGNVNYNVSSAQTGASSSNELFNVSYGSISGNPTLAGALISSVLTTGIGNATGLTITATAHSTGSATGLEIFTTGGSNDTAIAVRSGNVNIAGLTPSEPVFTDANDNLASVATVPIANGGTNSSATLTNGKVMISSGGAIVEGPAYSAGTFTGSITGNAATVTTTQTTTSLNFYPLFAALNTTGNQSVDVGTGLSFNPNTNDLTTTTFTGSLVGNASSATTAGSFSGSLSGDVTGTQSATAINNTSAAGGHIISALTTNAGTLTNSTTGNATTSTTAANIATTKVTTGTFVPTMVGSSSSSASTAPDVAAGFTYNAATDALALGVPGPTSGITGSLSLANTINANLTTIEAPVTGTPVALTYVLPNSAPSAGQVLSSSVPVSGIATLSWANASAGNVTSGTLINNGAVYATGASSIASTAQMTAGQLLIGTGASSTPALGGITTTGSGITATYTGGNIQLANTGVTSVGLMMPTIFTTGAAVTTTGNLTATLATETANTIFAGPTTGGAAAPTFRALVSADYPANTINYGSLQTETASTLLGNPTGSSANTSVITLGAGLSFSGTTLVATGAVSSVTAANTTLTISPTTGAVVAGLNLSNANAWLAQQTFSNTTTAAASATFSNTSTPASGTVLGATISSTGVSTGTASNVALQLTASGGTGSGALGNAALDVTAGTVVIAPFTVAGIVINSASGLISTSTSLPSGITIPASDIASSGVEYGPSAVQNTIAAGTTDLFDVAYAGTPGTTVNGAVINSTSSGTNVSATGLTVTAAGATAGGTVKALVLNSSNGAAATTYDVYGTSGNWSVNSTGLATVAGLGLTAPASEPAISTNTIDMPINSNSYFKLTAAAADNLDGIVAGTDGRMIVIVNEGTNTITVNSDESTFETTAANRIHLVGGAGNSLILAQDGIMTLIYDGTLGKWRVLSSK